MATGVFITLEGGEGSGKSTQTKVLGDNLRKYFTDHQVVVTREPGGTERAENIRQLIVNKTNLPMSPIGQLLLINAAREDHLRAKIIPHLKKGDWVICDRFIDSTTAYQGYGQGIDLYQITLLYQLISGSFYPDLTIILDVPKETASSRLIQRQHTQQKTLSNTDYFESLGSDFHQRVQDGFREIARMNPARCILLDAEGSVDEVQKRIIDIINKRYVLRIQHHSIFTP